MNTFFDLIDSLVQRGLCDHCLGRQIGKLATRTTNDERGRSLRLFHAMAHEFTIASTQPPEEDNSMETVEACDCSKDSVECSKDTSEINGGGGDQGVGITGDPEGIDTGTEKDQNPSGSLGFLHNGEISSATQNNGESCSLCGGLFCEIDNFVDLVVEALDGYEYSTYLIGTVNDNDIIQAESTLQEELEITPYAESIKSELNRVIGLKVFDRIGKEVSFGNPEIVAVVDTRFDSVSLQVTPIFLYGRYTKLDRTIPQTVWNCKRCRGRGCEYCDHTGKIYQTSVQEIIGDTIIEMTGGTRHLFHGMGREDIDARMLGTGRPFILEISQPQRRNIDIEEAFQKVNAGSPDQVGITTLAFTERSEVSRIKNMKTDKSYLAEVEFEADVDESKLREVEKEFTDTIISQRTPTRVAHRRSDLVRKRKVINTNCRLLGGRHAAFTIKGESGLYIKELIHGNEGRTQPSVSEFLGIECRVVALDVLEVHYDDDLTKR